MDTNHQSQAENREKEKTQYKCQECKDTYWILKDETYVRCKCYEIEMSKKIWEAAGINSEQSKMTFSNYIPRNEETKKAKDTAALYYKNFEKIKDTKFNSIGFFGQVGSGKTHLSIALAVNFLKKGIPVVYMPYRDVITNIKLNMRDEEYYQKQINKYQLARILLIDDLFKGKINSTDTNIMFEILNYRVLAGLPIIVSSEFTTEMLLNFDEAIGSRIIQMCKDYIVEIKGKDNNYRLKEV